MPVLDGNCDLRPTYYTFTRHYTFIVNPQSENLKNIGRYKSMKKKIGRYNLEIKILFIL